MKIMHGVIRNRISPLALAVTVLVCSVVWFVAAGVCYVTGASRDDWSTTPLFWTLILMVTPSVCFSFGVALVNSRRQSQLSRFDWCALVAAFFPVILGSVLAVMVAIWISGMSEIPQDAAVQKAFRALAGLVLVAISGTMIWKTTRNYLTRNQTDGRHAA